MDASRRIVSIRNPAIKELFFLRKGRARAREKRGGLALVRGRQLIQGIGEQFRFKRVFTHEPHNRLVGYNTEELVHTEKEVLRHVLFGPSYTAQEYAQTLDDDEFVVGTIEQPPPVRDFEGEPKWLLAVDGVKHPENMGLLLSTAVALKYDGVFFTGNGIDPFNYKVLEASQAAAWTMPYRFGSAEELVALCRRHRLAPCAADLEGTALTELQPLPQDLAGFCIALGNETRGVSPELLGASRRVRLPMSELTDSLNAGVAGGIIMHALACTWGR
mmetsp:Transcript_59824/g.154067  ORF Transcript_59824/g.154067 Transcript_59824/m.154067 type:complete len:274 (-) Transcript_59824:8-829(-)